MTFLHWWVWWGVWKSVWILPPADSPLLSCSPAAQKPVALKKKKRKERGESSQTRNESGNSYLAFLRSSVMSLSQIRLAGAGARTARTYRQRAVTWERASRRRGQFKIDLPQPKDWWSPFRLNCRVLDWTCTFARASSYWNWLLSVALSSSQVGNWVTTRGARGIDDLCDSYTVCVCLS